MDQRLSYYRPNVKTVSWVPKMMTHFVNCSVVNSYIVYSEFMGKPKSFSLLDFLGELIDDLAEPWIQLTRNEAVMAVETHHDHQFVSKSGWSKRWVFRMTGQHRCIIKEQHATRANGKICSHEKRGKCILCRTDIATMCDQCAVHLCVIKRGDTPTCFDLFHDSKDLNSLQSRHIEETTA